MSPIKGQKIKVETKDFMLRTRLDAETLEKLDYLVIEENSDRSKVIRQGIYSKYDELIKLNERMSEMTIGEREESIEEKVKRHTKEAEAKIDGWNRELQYAINQKDSQYQSYCEFMIKIWNNTLEQLNNYEIN